MDKRQKLEAIEKVLRELEDVKNSQTSLLKKIAQLETENINIGITVIEEDLDTLHEHTDSQLKRISDLTEKLQDYTDDFKKKNKLDLTEEVK